jgi:protein TonB
MPADRELPAMPTDTLPTRVKQHAPAAPLHAAHGRTETVLDEAVAPRRVPPPRPLALDSPGVPEASPAPPRAVAAVSNALPPPRAPVPPPARRTTPVDDVPVTATAPRDQPVLPAKGARSTAAEVLEQPLYGTAQRATHLVEARQGPALQELAARLHHAIETHKHYPLSARRLGREGTVEVAFLLRPDGLIGDLEVAASSGSRVLDSAALRAVESIAPFAPARGYLDAPARFRIAIAFSLR